MKKLLTCMLTLGLLAAGVLPALAAGNDLPVAPSPNAPHPAAEDTTSTGYAVEVNGENSGVRAHVLVPLRGMAEALGFSVNWDNGVITVTGAERYVELAVGKDQYFAAPTQEGMMGASLFSLGCAPVLMNDITYVPAELFNTLLGCKEDTIILEDNSVKISTAPASMDTAQIPNPFTDHATLKEAAKAVGFELTAPEEVNGSLRQNIQTINGKMIQVLYGNDENKICIRKAPGSDDISGDYNVYPTITSVRMNGAKVTMKGKNNLVHLATWTSGRYSYSILAWAGMSNADISALIQSVK